MKKQYIVQKFVMADNADEAIAKSKKTPIHEVFLHNNWLAKERNFNFFDPPTPATGFKNKT